MRLDRFVILSLAFSPLLACSGEATTDLAPQTIGAQSQSAPMQAGAANLPTFEVAGYEPDVSSVTVDLDAFPHARDYRIYDVRDPGRVAYAGLVLPANGKAPLVPSLQIDWNGLERGTSATLIAEALDALGPYPAANLASFDPALPVSCAGPSSAARTTTVAPLQTRRSEAIPLAGSSDGAALGGGISLGGRGCPNAQPRVIARSRPFVVRASASAPIPSNDSASSPFFSTFTNADALTLHPIVAGDPQTGSATLTLGAPPHTWTVLEDGADLYDTNVSIVDGALTDVLYDGPGPNGQNHFGRATLSLVPNATANLAGGRVIHATFEVGTHLDAHRTIGFELAPAADPLTSFAPDAAPHNRSENALFVTFGNTVTIDELAGARGTTQSALRAATFARTTPDRGLRDRERIDIYASATHLAIYESGSKLGELDLPRPLPFTEATLYFTHRLVRSGAESADLRTIAPYEDAWLRFTPYSDEKRWNNLGFEIVPPSVAWNTSSVRRPEREVASAR